MLKHAIWERAIDGQERKANVLLVCTDLTRNVYRWSPIRAGGSENAHTIDERVNMTVHMELVRFYYDFVRNFDASDVAKTGAASGEMEL